MDVFLNATARKKKALLQKPQQSAFQKLISHLHNNSFSRGDFLKSISTADVQLEIEESIEDKRLFSIRLSGGDRCRLFFHEDNAYLLDIEPHDDYEKHLQGLTRVRLKDFAPLVEHVQSRSGETVDGYPIPMYAYGSHDFRKWYRATEGDKYSLLLSSKQESVAQTNRTDLPLRLEGSAGCGKTYTLLTLLERFALEHPEETMLYLAPTEGLARSVKRSYNEAFDSNKQQSKAVSFQSIEGLFPGLVRLREMVCEEFWSLLEKSREAAAKKLRQSLKANSELFGALVDVGMAFFSYEDCMPVNAGTEAQSAYWQSALRLLDTLHRDTVPGARNVADGNESSLSHEQLAVEIRLRFLGLNFNSESRAALFAFLNRKQKKAKHASDREQQFRHSLIAACQTRSPLFGLTEEAEQDLFFKLMGQVWSQRAEDDELAGLFSKFAQGSKDYLLILGDEAQNFDELAVALLFLASQNENEPPLSHREGDGETFVYRRPLLVLAGDHEQQYVYKPARWENILKTLTPDRDDFRLRSETLQLNFRNSKKVLGLQKRIMLEKNRLHAWFDQRHATHTGHEESSAAQAPVYITSRSALLGAAELQLRSATAVQVIIFDQSDRNALSGIHRNNIIGIESVGGLEYTAVIIYNFFSSFFRHALAQNVLAYLQTGDEAYLLDPDILFAEKSDVAQQTLYYQLVLQFNRLYLALTRSRGSVVLLEEEETVLESVKEFYSNENAEQLFIQLPASDRELVGALADFNTAGGFIVKIETLLDKYEESGDELYAGQVFEQIGELLQTVSSGDDDHTSPKRKAGFGKHDIIFVLKELFPVLSRIARATGYPGWRFTSARAARLLADNSEEAGDQYLEEGLALLLVKPDAGDTPADTEDSDALKLDPVFEDDLHIRRLVLAFLEKLPASRSKDRKASDSHYRTLLVRILRSIIEQYLQSGEEDGARRGVKEVREVSKVSEDVAAFHADYLLLLQTLASSNQKNELAAELKKIVDNIQNQCIKGYPGFFERIIEMLCEEKLYEPVLDFLKSISGSDAFAETELASLPIHEYYGQCYAGLAEWDRAAENFQKAGLFARAAEACLKIEEYTKAADLYLEEGNFSTALALYEKAVREKGNPQASRKKEIAERLEQKFKALKQGMQKKGRKEVARLRELLWPELKEQLQEAEAGEMDLLMLASGGEVLALLGEEDSADEEFAGWWEDRLLPVWRGHREEEYSALL